MPQINEIRTNPNNPAQSARWDGSQWVDASAAQGPKPAPEWGPGAMQMPNGAIGRYGPKGGFTTIQAAPAASTADAATRSRLMLGLDPAVNAMGALARSEGYGSPKVENPYDRDWGATMLMGKGDNGSLNDWAARKWGGQDFQDYLQATKSFESSLMPIFSGAAVTDSEARRFIQANLPERGDTVKTLQTKTRNRKMILNASAELLGADRPFPDAPTWRAKSQPGAAAKPVRTPEQDPLGLFK